MKRFILLVGVGFFVGSVVAQAKLPPLEKAQLKKAIDTVLSVFGGQIKAADSSKSKSDLAKKLIDVASQTNSDQEGRYAVLHIAKDVAIGVCLSGPVARDRPRSRGYPAATRRENLRGFERLHTPTSYPS